MLDVFSAVLVLATFDSSCSEVGCCGSPRSLMLKRRFLGYVCQGELVRELRECVSAERAEGGGWQREALYERMVMQYMLYSGIVAGRPSPYCLIVLVACWYLLIALVH